MVQYAYLLRLAGYAVGALGGALLFIEFFMQPSYVEYSSEFGDYSINISPNEVREHTWIGRVGALLVSVAFALEFFGLFLA